MSKSYSMYRGDFATGAAGIAFVAANPAQFTVGTLITCADGTLLHVSAAGTAGTVTVV